MQDFFVIMPLSELSSNSSDSYAKELLSKQLLKPYPRLHLQRCLRLCRICMLMENSSWLLFKVPYKDLCVTDAQVDLEL